MGLNKPTLSIAPTPRKIRVIVADPYPVIVHGVRTMIEDNPRFKVVAEASTMMSFRKRLAAEQADVALLDWSMASEDLAALSELLQCDLSTLSVIFLTVSESSDQKREMLELGARGFLSKWTSARRLQKAILKVSDGRRSDPATETGAGSLPAPVGIDPRPESIQQLTQRERQLIPLVCGGLKNKEIALRLGIAETTVWHHLTSIFTKLRVDDRLGLAAFVYRHQLVFSDDCSTISFAALSNEELRPEPRGVNREVLEPVAIRTISHPPAPLWSDDEEEDQRLTGS
jgi:two-component system, NarL family, nitrate/nitrite response regulator NarL